MSLFAVITGDLVKSSNYQAADYERLLYLLDQSLRSLSPAPYYNIYRGDAFQLLLTEPGHAVRAALLLRLNLIAEAADARLCIAIGPVDNLRADIKTATGPVFTLSGTGLDQLAQQRWSLYCADGSQPLDLLLRFADKLLMQLTARQAQVLLLYLLANDQSHQALATELNTSRANITALLNQANYLLFNDFVQHCHNWIRNYVQ